MSMYKEWTPELVAALAEPFPAEYHMTKTQGGTPITFVSVHRYKERLNALVGPQGWEDRVRLEEHGGKLVAVVSLTVLGVTKENVGDEDDDRDSFGTAATNSYSQAFKRACADFGLGAYLYDEAKRNAATRNGRSTNGAIQPASRPSGTGPTCPVCDGPMYDNRAENENRKAKGLNARPAFKCKKQGCKGLYWDDPATTEQTPEGDAAEKDRMLAGIEAMIGELSGLNADRADKVQAALDDLIATENVTTDALRKFGSHVKTALDQEKATAVTVPADDEDLPF